MCVQKFNSNFEEIGCWTAHEGTILASTTTISNNRRIYATGGNDNTVAIWDLAGHPEQKDFQPIGNGLFRYPYQNLDDELTRSRRHGQHFVQIRFLPNDFFQSQILGRM